ncbi:MAG: hypothetical protein WCH46_06875 [bacterium]
MKTILHSLFIAVMLFVAASAIQAQIPRTITYQGVVVDGQGKFISDGTHNVSLKLYEAVDAPNAIYTENQVNRPFLRGIFDVIIGSVTPIPNTVGFDKPYFLGISVDGGNEMVPRTAISGAPYALMANGIVGGAVKSLNGQSGVVVLKSGTGTTLTSTNDTITINSTGVGGTGIQGVSNADNSIAVASPTGPTASIAVAVSGITTTKIADLAVTPGKIDGTGITAGMVLMANGLGGVAWQTAPGGGLTLPYLGSVVNNGGAFAIQNTGTGSGGMFTVTNATSAGNALAGNTNGGPASVGIYGQNSGTGRAGFIEVTNPASNATTLAVRTAGLGVVADISDLNAANSANILQVMTTGTGRVGFFQISNVTNGSNAIEATTNGNGNAIVGTAAAAGGVAGIVGKTTNAAGMGVYGVTADGGVGTNANSAVMGSSGNGNGVQGSTATGFGVEGYASSTGIGVHGVIGAGGTTARAAVFEQNAATVTGNVLEATSAGTGTAGHFTNTNAANTKPTLEGINASTTSTAIAVLGEISNSSSGPSNVATAVRGQHKGTTAIGIGVWGSHAGAGTGVYGSTVTGTGVQGYTSGDGVPVLATYGGASTSGTALQIDNGFMKVSGVTKTAYVHTTAAINIGAGGRTFLAYNGMAATDIVIVTHQLVAAPLKSAGGAGLGYGVVWNAGQNRWEIVLEDQVTAMPVGEKFNVMVIKQ